MCGSWLKALSADKEKREEIFHATQGGRPVGVHILQMRSQDFKIKYFAQHFFYSSQHTCVQKKFLLNSVLFCWKLRCRLSQTGLGRSKKRPALNLKYLGKLARVMGTLMCLCSAISFVKEKKKEASLGRVKLQMCTMPKASQRLSGCWGWGWWWGWRNGPRVK